MRDPKLFPPIKPEHAQAIGYVAAHWSLIEEQLGFIIYNLLSLHTIPGTAVTADLGVLQRRNLITALIDLSGNTNWINQWNDLSSTLETLRNKRNDAVHAAWRVSGPEHIGTRIKAKGKVKIESSLVPTTELQEVSTEILKLVGGIDQLISSLLKGEAAKIINQFHPPGWIPPAQAPAQSPTSPIQDRNPKRARQQLSRAQRRTKALQNAKGKGS